MSSYLGRLKKMLVAHKGPLLIVGIILIANSLYLTGAFTANPLFQRSGLLQSNKPGILRGSDTIDPNDGYTTQALGHEAARNARHGSLSWWNYDEQVGAPLAGEMQSAALFPLTLLLGFAGGLLFFHIALQLIAGLSTYYLLKKLGCTEWASVVGGALFALNGTFAWLTNAAFNPVAFLPLLLLGIETAYRSSVENQKRGWALIAVALALSLYAGFPETAFIDGLFAGAWFVGRVVMMNKQNRLPFLYKILKGVAVGVLLSAPILVAFASYYPHADVGVHSGAAGIPALKSIGLPALFMPYIYGPIFGFFSYDKSGALYSWWGSVGGFTSVSVVFVAALGLRNKKQRVLVLTLSLWLLVVVGRIYGLPLISQIVNAIPGVSVTAFYRYAFPSVSMALVILVAFGVDSLRNRIKWRSLIAIVAPLLAVLFGLSAYAYHEHSLLVGAPHHRVWLLVSVVWAAFMLLTISGAILRFRHKTRYIVGAILVADALAMFMIPHLSAPRQPQIDIAPVSYLKANLGQSRFFSLGPIAPNYGSYYGIASINTNNLPIAKDWANYVTKHLYNNVDPILFTGTNQANPNGLTPLEGFVKNEPAYEAVGVKYLIAPSGHTPQSAVDQAHLKLVFTDTIAQIYELQKPKPYFETSSACKLVSPAKDKVAAVCHASSTLVRRELYLPGWRATVNGQSAAVSRSNEIFQAVTVPAGASRVSFSFTPPFMSLAYVLFALGFVWIMVDYCNLNSKSIWSKVRA